MALKEKDMNDELSAGGSRPLPTYMAPQKDSVARLLAMAMGL